MSLFRVYESNIMASLKESQCETLAPSGGTMQLPGHRGPSSLGCWSSHSITKRDRTKSWLTNQDVKEANAKAHADESNYNHFCDESENVF